MLDTKFIRENADAVKKACQLKCIDLDIDKILDLDKEVTALKTQMQELQTKKNAASKQIPKASAEERPKLIEESKKAGAELDKMKEDFTKVESELAELLWLVPQIPSDKAPVGKDDSENVEVKLHGEVPSFSFEPLDHVDILEKNEWAEFEKVAKVCGSRSYSLRNEMVLLEMALHRFAMDKLRKKGFTLVSTPALAREHALYGTGHFPTGKDQVYHLPEDDLYLSGTAEVQLNSFHGGEILSESDLPIFYAGYSPCFRREAGSYGRDVRGLIRVHQFQKTEQYIICKNDIGESEKWHKMLLETSEEIVQELELPYRIVECCTGDMGTGKVRMYDIECWVPSEQKYRETHSCSALHDWQSRRTNTRYRDSEGNVQYVHTLNNTAVATPRIIVPFLENHQLEDGSVKVPEKLRPYLSGLEILKKI
ncbi:serine--tRNA ligase [Halobacteriovorax sp. GB3]|uniref:serine--tRNA ligase n=1 Tax=Halobacteriovorax sp. GB3 TaxID=2719615 RepID=UPI0023617C2C|nr:serine--tRNA ligase [Halobacteriovorax sp. GB3]MDD0851915.1 serine--tRNA ligase [Halobacteriovorax sp. GB3]